MQENRLDYQGIEMLVYRKIKFWRDLWNEVMDDDVFNGAAAMAFFLLLSIFPATIFLISLIPYLSVPHLQQAIMDLLHQVLPEQSAKLFEGTVKQVVADKKGGLLTFGIVFTLWSASTGIYAIMQQLNITYDAKERRPFWKVRGTAILLTFLFIILVIGSLSLVIFGGVIQSWMAALIGWSKPLLLFFATLRWIIIAFFLLLGLAVIYRFGPDTNQRFNLISPGNSTGAALIALASFGFRLYVSSFGNYNATYGSLGAMIILMLWLYLTGVSLLIGSEINALIAKRYPEGKDTGRNNSRI
jgi:membrane protein